MARGQGAETIRAQAANSRSKGGIPVRRVLRVSFVLTTVILGTALDLVVDTGRRVVSGDRAERAGERLVRRLRGGFEVLGPTFVKLGQLISSSPGSFPHRWVEVFASCQSDVAAAPASQIADIVRSELGTRALQLIDLSTEPIAAGSIAQVHSARLADGTEVVVKVQRPGIERVLAEDVRMLRFLARVATALRPSLRAANPAAIVDEFAAGLAEQISFRRELSNICRMREVLHAWPIVLPAPVESLSTERVLVMERIRGVRIDDAAGVEAIGADASALLRTLAGSLLDSALCAGTFHGDLHAGNMLVTEDGRLALLDFGVLGSLAPSTRSAVRQLLLSVLDKDLCGMASAMVELADGADLGAAIPEIQAWAFRALAGPLSDLDIAEVLGDLLGIASRHGIVLPGSLVAFFKQVMYLDGVACALDPSFDLLADGAALMASPAAA